MASNGLVANAAKTVFMILNRTKAKKAETKFDEIEVDGVTIITYQASWSGNSRKPTYVKSFII